MGRIYQLFVRTVTQITWALSIVGMIGLVILSCAIVADIVMTTFNHPITGVRDMLSLFIAVCVGFMMPVLLLKEGNIAVQFIVAVVGNTIGTILQILANLATCTFFFLAAYRLFDAAAYMSLNNETTQVMGVPTGPWWTLVAACFLFSCIACLVPIFNGILSLFKPSQEAVSGGNA